MADRDRKTKSVPASLIVFAVMVTIGALGLRMFVALRLPTDEPDDGRLYATIARNVLEHHSFSIETEEPYPPTLIRLPGYPLFLAGIYRLFGVDNNRAVRVTQALVDTLTCWLVALLALAWAPVSWQRERRRRALLIALALAAFSPFLVIYVATILTETCNALFAVASVLAATLALKAERKIASTVYWLAAGVTGGVATLFRPDSALFVGAIGVTLVAVGLRQALAHRPNGSANGSIVRDVARIAAQGLLLSAGFVVVLAPWTIRNARVFGLFQPLAPSAANMPGQFVPSGYVRWLRTWVDDFRYTEKIDFPLDVRPIHFEQMPDSAFDTEDERQRVAALLERYNNPPWATKPPPVTPPVTPEVKGEGAESAGEDDDTGDDDSADGEEEAPEESSSPEPVAVEMSPAIDAGFAEIAAERIARRPVRYYFVLPLKRVVSMWFDTHSQYYPFQGELFPLAELNHDLHQQYWLPLFAVLVWLYTALGVGGSWVMWRSGEGRLWLLLLALLIVPRLAFLSSLRNPEPRYVIGLFAFVAAAGGLIRGLRK